MQPHLMKVLMFVYRAKMGRGTFFHRHAVVHNQMMVRYVPLTHLHANQGRFEVWILTFRRIRTCF